MFDPNSFDALQQNTIAEYISLNDTFVDKYQRPVHEGKVNAIIRSGFDPDALATVVLSLRNPDQPFAGLYAVVDGNHRIQVCRKLGITHIFARVCIDKSYEEEAELYCKLNARHRLSALDLFRARIEQRELQAMEMRDILATYDLKVAKDGLGAVNAVHALDRLYIELGPKGFNEVIGLIKRAWRLERRAWIGPIIDGVKAFWIRYYVEVDEERLIDRLSMTRPEDILRDAGYGKPQKGVVSTRIGKVIVEYYNNGLRRNKLSEWKDFPGRGYDGKGGWPKPPDPPPPAPPKPTPKGKPRR